MDSERAAKIGHIGGMLGGKERAARLTAERRSAIAKKAAEVRWHQKKAGHHSAQDLGDSDKVTGRWRVVNSTANVPKAAGVYEIYKDDILVYIGATGNLRARVRKHLRDTQSIVGIIKALIPGSVVTVKYCLSRNLGDAFLLERSCIKKKNPLLNHCSGVPVDPDSIGGRITARRMTKLIPQKKLAKMVGMSRLFLGRVEAGIIDAPLDKLALIAKALECKVEDFI